MAVDSVEQMDEICIILPTGQKKFVSGLAYDTRCSDIVAAVLESVELPDMPLLYLWECWQSSSRLVKDDEPVLPLLAQWGEFVGDVRFELRPLSCVEARSVRWRRSVERSRRRLALGVKHRRKQQQSVRYASRHVWRCVQRCRSAYCPVREMRESLAESWGLEEERLQAKIDSLINQEREQLKRIHEMFDEEFALQEEIVDAEGVIQLIPYNEDDDDLLELTASPRDLALDTADPAVATAATDLQDSAQALRDEIAALHEQIKVETEALAHGQLQLASLGDEIVAVDDDLRVASKAARRMNDVMLDAVRERTGELSLESNEGGDSSDGLRIPTQHLTAVNGDTPAKVNPVNDAIAKAVPVNDTLAKMTPVNDMLAKMTPVNDTIAKAMPVETATATVVAVEGTAPITAAVRTSPSSSPPPASPPTERPPPPRRSSSHEKFRLLQERQGKKAAALMTSSIVPSVTSSMTSSRPDSSSSSSSSGTSVSLNDSGRGSGCNEGQAGTMAAVVGVRPAAGHSTSTSNDKHLQEQEEQSYTHVDSLILHQGRHPAQNANKRKQSASSNSKDNAPPSDATTAASSAPHPATNTRPSPASDTAAVRPRLYADASGSKQAAATANAVTSSSSGSTPSAETSRRANRPPLVNQRPVTTTTTTADVTSTTAKTTEHKKTLPIPSQKSRAAFSAQYALRASEYGADLEYDEDDGVNGSLV
ncbi:mucin-5AC-like [Sycon ciliatum]|uniref:mucin-5AC-like n=1 Tax=Sycon ciliatum TaxID=27933 RepID=UPI0031F65D7F